MRFGARYTACSSLQRFARCVRPAFLSSASSHSRGSLCPRAAATPDREATTLTEQRVDHSRHGYTTGIAGADTSNGNGMEGGLIRPGRRRTWVVIRTRRIAVGVARERERRVIRRLDGTRSPPDERGGDPWTRASLGCRGGARGRERALFAKGRAPVDFPNPLSPAWLLPS